jgi:heat shock protein HslJ
MWIGFTGPNDQVGVETLMNYSLVFQPDGKVNITADCNNAQGSYQEDGQSIKIQVGPMTKAMCPPGSHSDEYIQYLGSAATYSFQDGNLYIDLAADGGTMVFAPSEAVMADDDAWRSAIQANPWQWASFTSPVEQYDVHSPENYLLTFHKNGIVDIKADCNAANGTYTMQGNRISIVIGPTTMAACPPGSRNEEFMKYLGSAAIYFFQPGELFIDLVADGGTMMFTPFIP